jgi:RNA polymerase sigma factor (sigma-70 family)
MGRGGGDGGGDGRVGGGRRSAARTIMRDATDRQLVLGMQREELPAMREFFARFAPMLSREAHRLGARGADVDEIVIDVLDDVALALARPDAPVPRSLSGYLVRTLRNALVNARRARLRQHGRATRAMGITGDDIVAQAASRASLHAAAGPDHEPPRLSPVLERLVATLDAGLTEDERRILAWVGEWVPQRLIADWLGISYGAVRVRVMRLRERLHAAAHEYAATLDDAERAVLEAFFRRTATRETDGPDVTEEDP